MSLAWRRASEADAVALRDLERRASLAALGSVFGGVPFPDDAVLERWHTTLAEPGVVVELADGEQGPTALLAADDELLRHLAVDPAVWGRGIGASAVGRAVARASGPLRLWCLADNERARSLYERLGWAATGHSRRTPWPPHPVEVELAHRPGASA